MNNISGFDRPFYSHNIDLDYVLNAMAVRSFCPDHSDVAHYDLCYHQAMCKLHPENELPHLDELITTANRILIGNIQDQTELRALHDQYWNKLALVESFIDQFDVDASCAYEFEHPSDIYVAEVMGLSLQ